MGRRRRTAATAPVRTVAQGPPSSSSPSSSSIPGMDAADLSARLGRIRELYAQLPVLDCRGLCAHSCGQHVDASTAERAHLLTRHGLDLDAPTPDGACPALTRTWGPPRCLVHLNRPMICRLWGTAAAMPCPHGCTPEGGHLDDTATLELLSASLDAGGHPHSGLGDLLHQVMDDPIAAGLMGRFLRGDHTVAPALTHHLHATGITRPRR